MKKALLICWLLMPLLAFSKADSVISINKIPPTGLVLKNGWKFHIGDDKTWANPAFDDNKWQKIDPTLFLPDLPGVPRQGMGWLRIRLNVTPALRRYAAISVWTSTAIEVYLNGQLVGKRGSIDQRTKTGIGYVNNMDPIELPLTDQPEQIVAIRFVQDETVKYINGYMFTPFLWVKFLNLQQPIHSIARTNLIEFSALIGSAILLLLAVFHLILLHYNRQKGANLYFAIYAICFAVFLCGSVAGFIGQSTATYVYSTIVCQTIYAIGCLFCIKAIYTLFEFTSKWFYSLLTGITVICILIWPFDSYTFNYTWYGMIVLFNCVQFVITIKGFLAKKRGALFIVCGFFTGLVGVATFTYLSFAYQGPPVLLYVISISLTALGPPLGISFYLGREFALDGQLLAIKLQQVEELSATNLAQEQEKQLFLASQNETLEQQVLQRTAELSQSLDNLKQAQTQLIQSEKMASLGELTAGIAHEIQNPLNFVNNFSEVNTELIDEMQVEIDKGDYEEVKAIAGDIKANQIKISQQGKRADFIVKGMLQHSRTSTGERQETNINILADEFLKLSYHGLRAKDKTFNADMITHFDENLPKVNIVQQDIGRVLLNLFNNAFYAVNQKKKTAGADYKPEVSLTTSTQNGQVIISVKDNGNGISDAIKDKIMQPFFTTKPTGEGTGLGLSLSYDIVVKGHGGKIDIFSEEGVYTEFVVCLLV